MIKDIKNTVKQSAIYGFSRISIKLVSFILLPIYTLKLSVADYGVFVRIESLWQILWGIYLFGLETAIIKWYNDITDEQKKRKFLFTVIIFVLALNVLFNVIIYSTTNIFSDVIFNSFEYNSLILFASVIASLEAILFVFFLIIRMQNRALLYTLLSIFATVLNLAIQLYFLFYTQYILQGIFISKILSSLIVLLLLLPFFIKRVKIGFESKYLVQIVKFSFPIMIATLLSTLLNQIDRYILGVLSDSASVGIYGLAYNIAGSINLFIVAPFALAFSVISWNKYKEDNANRFFTKCITYLFLAMIYSALILSLIIPNIIKIFTLNTAYWIAKDYVPLIALSTPFYGIVTIGLFSFFATNKTSYIVVFYFVAVLVKVVLNILLINIFDINGAVISNYLSFLLLSVIIYIYSKRQYFIKYEWYKMAIMTISASILILPFYLFNFQPLLLQIILKLIAAVLFPILLFLFKFYEPIELIMLKGFFKKYYQKALLKQ